MILKARAENDSSSVSSRVSFSVSLTFMPFTGGRSAGLGRNWMTASSRGWTPLFLNAEPSSTGTISPAMVALRMAARSSSSEISSSSRNFIMRSSSAVATVSTSSARYSAAWSARSAGMSTSSQLAPRSSDCQIRAFIFSRSTTPANSDS